jgi:hypothetical protein
MRSARAKVQTLVDSTTPARKPPGSAQATRLRARSRVGGTKGSWTGAQPTRAKHTVVGQAGVALVHVPPRRSGVTPPRPVESPPHHLHRRLKTQGERNCKHQYKNSTMCFKQHE